jgi:hypothetical protein
MIISPAETTMFGQDKGNRPPPPQWQHQVIASATPIIARTSYELPGGIGAAVPIYVSKS